MVDLFSYQLQQHYTYRRDVSGFNFILAHVISIFYDHNQNLDSRKQNSEFYIHIGLCLFEIDDDFFSWSLTKTIVIEKVWVETVPSSESLNNIRGNL